MHHRTKALISFTAAFAVILFILWLAVREAPKADQNQEVSEIKTLTEPTITFIDPSRGPREATITIVEYGDYTCEHCALAHETIKQLMAANNRVRFVWKDAPTIGEPLSEDAAMAARCAERQRKFWPYHDELFALQTKITEASFLTIAKSLKLNEEAFTTCLESKETLPLVKKIVEEAQALGLTALPTFFVNGKTRVESNPTLEEWGQIIEQAI